MTVTQCTYKRRELPLPDPSTRRPGPASPALLLPKRRLPLCAPCVLAAYWCSFERRREALCCREKSSTTSFLLPFPSHPAFPTSAPSRLPNPFLLVRCAVSCMNDFDLRAINECGSDFPLSLALYTYLTSFLSLFIRISTFHRLVTPLSLHEALYLSTLATLHLHCLIHLVAFSYTDG